MRSSSSSSGAHGVYPIDFLQAILVPPRPPRTWWARAGGRVVVLLDRHRHHRDREHRLRAHAGVPERPEGHPPPA
eukprot:5503281-Pyramimonas_sp.AAC.1